MHYLNFNELLKKVKKYKWLVALFVFAFIYLLWISYTSSPKNLIVKSLHSYGIDTYTVDTIKIEKVDSKHYKLLNPPIEPSTRVVLENWEICSFGSMRGYTFATSLDISDYYSTIEADCKCGENGRCRSW